jgi:hypothetical protein
MINRILIWLLTMFVSINLLRAAHHAMNNDDWKVAVLFVVIAYLATHIPSILKENQDEVH